MLTKPEVKWTSHDDAFQWRMEDAYLQIQGLLPTRNAGCLHQQDRRHWSKCCCWQNTPLEDCFRPKRAPTMLPIARSVKKCHANISPTASPGTKAGMLGIQRAASKKQFTHVPTETHDERGFQKAVPTISRSTSFAGFSFAPVDSQLRAKIKVSMFLLDNQVYRMHAQEQHLLACWYH